MITHHQLLREGEKRLLAAGQGEQAALLLFNELARRRGVNLYMDLDEPCSEQLQIDYLEGLHRMELGEPLGYVLGEEPFYGYDFIVNKDVLIPRPETEELVALVLSLMDEEMADVEHPKIFDVGTGSGAIAISLSLEEPRADVFASDISRPAVIVAEANNQKLNGRVCFLIGDMLEPFIDRDLHCDILVCNPPYIPNEENMEKSVVDFEPHVALFGGADGLNYYRTVFERAPKVLNDHAILAFEMGWNQGQALKELASKAFPGAKIEIHQDLNGKDRMLSIVTGSAEADSEQE